MLFAGAQAFQDGVVAAVLDAAGDVAPIDAAVAALAEGGTQLAQYGQYARGRRDLIASSPDLQERELIKMASLAKAVAGALHDRGTEALHAGLAAQAGVAAFTGAYDQWVDSDGAADLPALICQSLDELRRAICCTRGTPMRPAMADP